MTQVVGKAGGWGDAALGGGGWGLCCAMWGSTLFNVYLLCFFSHYSLFRCYRAGGSTMRLRKLPIRSLGGNDATARVLALFGRWRSIVGGDRDEGFIALVNCPRVVTWVVLIAHLSCGYAPL